MVIHFVAPVRAVSARPMNGESQFAFVLDKIGTTVAQTHGRTAQVALERAQQIAYALNVALDAQKRIQEADHA